MAYFVKELYYTLQGEGAQTGRAAVFLRFAGCNLWSGQEEDRADAVCQFCDTQFVGTDGPGGGRFADAEELAQRAAETWKRRLLPLPLREGTAKPLIVLTGGEPLLQTDAPLIPALRKANFEIAVETNGTLPLPAPVDWLTVSPKANARLVLEAGDELKLIYPQTGAEPERFAHLAFPHFYLQPMDGPHVVEHTRAAVAYCLAHPQWRLSLQTHKLLGLP